MTKTGSVATTADEFGTDGGPSAWVGSTRRLRVLHVEDSEDDAALVLHELRSAGYEIDALRVETAEQMTAALRDRTWDLVLSDHSLPTFSAPRAFAVMRELGLDLPFIIVSGTMGEEVAVASIRAGVHDYLLKDNLRRLGSTIERELREAARRAEQRRTQEQLFIAERMASVGTLAAGVAHEINNPLSIVIGSLEAAIGDIAASGQPEELWGRLREMLADASEAAERVRVIVRDLRVFSRADEEARGPVDVRKVIDSALRMARNEIRHRAETVVAFGDTPLVYGNESRLGQVFLNLIVNAVHAMPEGRTDRNTIRLVTREQEERVIVEVSDTGTGIPREVLPRIFDVFFTTKPIGLGTGLGLSICHRIITGMGGEIAVETAVGVGTTFRLSLPSVRAEVGLAPPSARPATPDVGRRAAILIVDDEPGVGRTLQRLLSANHDITVVSSGRDAMTCLTEGGQFDLILCDLMMPHLTGMDIYAELLRRGTDLAHRMIFMTGGAFTTGGRDFLARVQNPRIEKPIDTARLRLLIRTALDWQPPSPPLKSEGER